MSRLAIALALSFALAAHADDWRFPAIHVGRGGAGTYLVSLTVNGAQQDLASASGTLTVYQRRPTATNPGVALFAKPLVPAPSGDPRICGALPLPCSVLAFTVSPADTATPGGPWPVEIVVTNAGFTDSWHGEWVTEGP